MQNIQISLPQNLSFSRSLTSPHQLFLPTRLSNLSLTPKTTSIRMGGGPRTYPGGVSKWQWKRMQANKAKQLLKARLCRERQIYEMRKRAELKAAVSELERPWEVVERAPNLFSVRADEQLKVLADRFQKPGGFDMWSERDGPQVFQRYDGVPSARFFPKGVVHSLKPYESDGREEGLNSDGEGENAGAMVGQRSGYRRNRRNSRRGLRGGSFSEVTENGVAMDFLSGQGSSGAESSNVKNSVELSGLGMNGQSGRKSNGKLSGKGNRKMVGAMDLGSTSGSGSRQVGFIRKQRGKSDFIRGGDSRIDRSYGSQKLKNLHSKEVYDMNLEEDGSYGFQGKSGKHDSKSRGKIQNRNRGMRL